MGSYLKQCGRKWDRWQVAQALKCRNSNPAGAQGPAGSDVKDYPGKEYRIVNARNHTLSKFFTADVKEMLTDDTAFATVPLEDRSEKLQALAFRASARAGAHHHEELTNRHANYPFKFFDVIAADPQKLEAIAKDLQCPHRLCPWSAHMVKGRGGEKSAMDVLTDKLLVAETRLTADEWHIDIGPIEHGHASFQRLRLAKSHHTHVVDFAEVSSRWMVMRTNDNLHEQWWATRARAKADAKVKRKRRKDYRPRKLQQSGGGCRAYISQMSKGVKLTPESMSSHSKQYKALPDEERKKYEANGKEAKRLRVDGVAAPFGQSLKRARTVEDRWLDSTTSDAPTGGVAPVGVLSVQRGTTLPRDRWYSAQVAVKQAAKDQIREEAEARMELQKYVQETMSSKIIPVEADHPAPQFSKDALSFVPFPDAENKFQWACPAAEQSTHAFSAPAWTTTSQGMGDNRLVADFSHMHDVIMHDLCEPIEPQDLLRFRRLRLRPCWLANRCVCKEPGASLCRFRNTVARLRRLFFILFAVCDEMKARCFGSLQSPSPCRFVKISQICNIDVINRRGEPHPSAPNNMMAIDGTRTQFCC